MQNDGTDALDVHPNGLNMEPSLDLGQGLYQLK